MRWLLFVLFFLFVSSGKAGTISDMNAVYDGNIFEIFFRKDENCQLMPLSTKEREIRLNLKGCKVNSPISIGERGDLIKRATITPVNNSSLLTIELKRDAKLKTSVKDNFVRIKVIPSELIKPEITVKKFSKGELVKINLEKKPEDVTYRKVSDGFLITLSGLKLEKFSLAPESQLVKRIETQDTPAGNVMKVTLTGSNSVEITNHDKEVTIKVFELPKLEETKSETNSENVTVSLKFDDVDVRTVIKAITKGVGVNVVIDPEVKGTVSIDFSKPVFWKEALRAVLEPLGFTYRETGDYLRILPESKIMDEKRLESPKFYIIRLNYADAKEVKKEIEELVFKYATKYTEMEEKKENNKITKESEEKSIKIKKGNKGVIYKETITVDKSNNALLLKVMPDHYREIVKIIKDIDKPVKQVVVKARIVQIQSKVTKDLGISWLFSGYNRLGGGTYISGSYGFGVDKQIYTNLITENTYGKIYQIPVNDSTLALGVLNKAQTLRAELAIRALQIDGEAEIMSTPKVLTLDNKEATIEQGVEIPYKESTVGSGGATSYSISFKKASLILKVKPHITNDNQIILDLEIRKDSPNYEYVSLTGNSEPAIDTRNVKSRVRIASGSTIVIGGIYEKEKSKSKTGVPVVSRIPLLGWLFKRESTVTSDKKLLIFITPEVIR